MIKRLIENLKTLRLYFVINMLKFKSIWCYHKFVIEKVNISNDISEQCKLLYSHTNSKIYNKFIIPNGDIYHKCIKCGKIKF
jgi:hypothetical protein